MPEDRARHDIRSSVHILIKEANKRRNRARGRSLLSTSLRYRRCLPVGAGLGSGAAGFVGAAQLETEHRESFGALFGEDFGEGNFAKVRKIDDVLLFVRGGQTGKVGDDFLDERAQG